MTIEGPEDAVQRLLELGRSRQWGPYFRTLRELHRPRSDADEDGYDPQPAPEHTTLDPWPGEIGVPVAIAKLEKLAREQGWEVRLGYSRGYKKLGRGKVGGTGDARWARHHFIRVQVRESGTGRGAFATYAADAEGTALRWTSDVAWIDGHQANVTAFRAFLSRSE